MNESVKNCRIRITQVPDGSAPIDIRMKWVGLTLPCDPILGFTDAESDALRDRPILPRRSVYVVDQAEAIRILEEHFPDAALWWKQHGFPQVGRFFCFAEDEAEGLGGITRQILHRWDDQDRQFVS